MDDASALDALSSISNATRLRVLKCLVRAGEDGLTAGDIAAAVGASPSRTSFHLSNLSGAGLIVSERQSRQISYRVDFQALGGLIRYILHDCCGNNAVVRDCCLSGDCC